MRYVSPGAACLLIIDARPPLQGRLQGERFDELT